MKIISRKTGRSSTAAAAYRSGTEIADMRTGEVHDYSKKQGVEHSEILMPEGSEWEPERGELWNKVEEKNKRQDAQVAREIVVALPDELSAEERKQLALEFGQEIADRYQLGVDVAVHAPNREGDQRNHHAHILMTTNRIAGRGLGNKARELDKVAQQRAQKAGQTNEVEHLREKWGTLVNNSLERSQSQERVDHRSFERLGREEAPTVHLGPQATAMERRGEQSERGSLNRIAAGLNRQFSAARTYLADNIQLARQWVESVKQETAEQAEELKRVATEKAQKLAPQADKALSLREALRLELTGLGDLDRRFEERKAARDLDRRFEELKKQREQSNRPRDCVPIVL